MQKKILSPNSHGTLDRKIFCKEKKPIFLAASESRQKYEQKKFSSPNSRGAPEGKNALRGTPPVSRQPQTGYSFNVVRQ
jgi:hypothetical protein